MYQDVLHDYSSSGKERQWKEKKKRTELLSMVYANMARHESSIELAERYKKRAVRLTKCGRVLTFTVFSDGSKRLKKAQFCKLRLCCVCSWRRSLKIYANMTKIMEQLKREREYRFLMLTLTVKNCTGEELNETILQMQKAYGLLYRRKEFAVIKGWYRGLEVTHNKKMNTYHPHYHVILAVNKSYFHLSSGDGYITQKKWVALWRSCMGLDYDPIVDVRKIYGNTVRAVSEVAKYTVKDSDFLDALDLDMSREAIRILDKALEKKRLVAYGGILKEMHRRLNLGDEVDGDLTHIDEDKIREGTEVLEETYIWNTGYGNYLRHYQKEIKKEEGN